MTANKPEYIFHKSDMEGWCVMVLGRAKSTEIRTTETLIGEGTLCDGKLQADYNIRLEGKFKGEIDCKSDVTVGEQAELQANIQGVNVVIAGYVKGDITAKEKLVITSSGQLEGNIQAKGLVIHEGGLFQGISLMPDREESSSKIVQASAHKQQKKEQHKQEQQSASGS